MAYLPLARKYRPQTFADLIGQPHVSATLTRALEGGRIAQAYLFAGARGVGKTSVARILAKCLNCAKGPTPTPCNDCPSCVQVTQGNSLDVIEIDGASNRGIDEIRSLREMVPFAPTTGRFRVTIIDEVHMLTTEAFNALLKTLEEPPAHVKFIFATTAPTKVPATILSRCQRFDFRRIDTPTVVQVLKRVAAAERVKADDAALFAIARASEGSLRDAEVVLDQVASFTKGAIRESDVTELLGSTGSTALISLTQAMVDHQSAEALSLVASQLDRGAEPTQVLADLLRHLRNLLIIRRLQDDKGHEELLARLIDEPAERLQALREQAGRLAAEEWMGMLQVLAAAYDMVRRSPLGRTILELVLIKLCSREPWQSLEEISRRLEQLGTGRAASAAAPALREPAAPAPAQPASRPAAAPAPQAAAAASAQVPSASPAAEELAPVWAVFLERISAQKMSLAAYLMHAKPLRRDGNIVTVGLPGFSLHHEVLSVADNRRLIDRLLSEACGAAVTIQYATLPAGDDAPASAAGSPAQVEASVPPVVQDIVNLFNATIMNTPPKSA